MAWSEDVDFYEQLVDRALLAFEKTPCHYVSLPIARLDDPVVWTEDGFRRKFSRLVLWWAPDLTRAEIEQSFRDQVAAIDKERGV